jgi:ribose-phosphate pyrophosphokinase
MTPEMILLTGNANPALASSIAKCLGIEVGRALVSRFSDGETQVRILENARGRHVFVLQPTCTPVNENLMELLLMIDALHRASAKPITAVIPYFGYARQERKTAGREPISARAVANLLEAVGTDRVLTIDLHAPAIEGFFNIPVDHLRASPILANYFQKLGLADVAVVSPDSGGVARATRFADRLGASLAIITKQRSWPGKAEVLGMIGNVRDKTAIIVDDMISSGGTLLEAADLLLEQGARQIYASAIHPVFTPGAVERLRDASLAEVVVTDTIPYHDTTPPWEKLTILSVAPLLAEAIARIHEHRTVSELFI